MKHRIRRKRGQNKVWEQKIQLLVVQGQFLALLLENKSEIHEILTGHWERKSN